MHMVGVVEIVAGFVVLVSPRFGGLLVAAWLGGIIGSLLLVGGYGDIVLRDFGLLLAALALNRVATAYAERGGRGAPVLGFGAWKRRAPEWERRVWRASGSRSTTWASRSS